VGSLVGEPVGSFVVGDLVGDTVGCRVGHFVGSIVGGTYVGVSVGLGVGSFVGLLVIGGVGCWLGSLVCSGKTGDRGGWITLGLLTVADIGPVFGRPGIAPTDAAIDDPRLEDWALSAIEILFTFCPVIVTSAWIDPGFRTTATLLPSCKLWVKVAIIRCLISAWFWSLRLLKLIF
jgi:hypothetical protein